MITCIFIAVLPIEPSWVDNMCGAWFISLLHMPLWSVVSILNNVNPYLRALKNIYTISNEVVVVWEQTRLGKNISKEEDKIWKRKRVNEGHLTCCFWEKWNMNICKDLTFSWLPFCVCCEGLYWGKANGQPKT